MLPTVAVIAIVVLSIFALCLFAASYGDLSNRVDALAESQVLLSQSQVELSSAFQEIAPLVGHLSAEHDATIANVQHLSKAVQQQAVTALKHQLVSLCSGDCQAAKRQYDLERTARPGQDDEWYFKQAIRSLTSSSSSPSRSGATE